MTKKDFVTKDVLGAILTDIDDEITAIKENYVKKTMFWQWIGGIGIFIIVINAIFILIKS